ncbi:MAG: hypothetical protein OQK35_04970 [Alphaproteobacteria bacterium]|nr:hypothetical protein [Alphaproteobacteria bacterium]
MDKLDTMINEALDDEDRLILEKIGREQTLAEAALDLFRGKLGWLNGVLLLGHLLFAIAGAYAAWKFFTLTEILDVIRWGISAAVLLLAALIMRVTIYPAIQANRILRAMKHMEMQISLLRTKH